MIDNHTLVKERDYDFKDDVPSCRSHCKSLKAKYFTWQSPSRIGWSEGVKSCWCRKDKTKARRIEEIGVIHGDICN